MDNYQSANRKPTKQLTKSKKNTNINNNELTYCLQRVNVILTDKKEVCDRYLTDS